jgi:hypothetical protein
MFTLFQTPRTLQVATVMPPAAPSSVTRSHECHETMMSLYSGIGQHTIDLAPHK